MLAIVAVFFAKAGMDGQARVRPVVGHRIPAGREGAAQGGQVCPINGQFFNA